jgi:hypothetical protein
MINLYNPKSFWTLLPLVILLADCGNKAVKNADGEVISLPKPENELVVDPAADLDSSRQIQLSDPAGKAIPIFVYPEAPPRTRACAEELADYLEKMVGSRPQIIFSEPVRVPERAIWIGIQPSLKKIFPDRSFTFQYPEEILIYAQSNHIVIAGKDRWLQDSMNAQGRNRTIDGLQQDYGTCNAIYTFLQNYLNIRWLGPGELWEDYTKRKSLAIPSISYRYHPEVRSRDGILRLIALGDDRSSEEEKNWAIRQRLLYSSLSIDGGHGFTDWWEKYHEEHPEYFALLPNGKREPLDDPKMVKLCVSNPAVWQQWLIEVRKTLRENPSQEVFNASPNDGWNRGQCTCDNCRAWDVVPMTDPSPNMSDRNIRFANKLAGLLRDAFPEQAYYVKMSAYGDYARKLPVNTKVDDNVIVAAVHSFFLRNESENPDYLEMKRQFIGWGKIAKHLVWRLNLPNYAGHVQGMPDIALEQSYADVRFAAAQGIEGIWIDTYWGHWSTQLPQYYLLAQMAWNPAQDYNAIMDDFYTRAYGKASNAMKQYWELMDQTRTDLMEAYPEKHSFFLMHRTYDGSWLESARSKLNQALSLADGDELIKKRIHFHQFGLETVESMLELRRLQSEFAEGQISDSKRIKQKIDELWEKTQQRMEAAPAHAFNKGYIMKDPENDRYRSMHYEFVPNNKIRRAIKKYR